MTLKRGTRVNRGYATVVDDEGINYREIADTMTELGFSMNHSSARNYVLRVMRKFVDALVNEGFVEIEESKRDEIAKSPTFQHGIADLLHSLEMERRGTNVIVTGRSYE